MSWAKIDDRFFSHPKVLATSLAARGLWVSALSWVAGARTNGLVPHAVVAMVGGTPRLADELVAAGLWVTHPHGYAVHDFLAYNPSTAESDERRARRAASGRIGGKRSAEARRSNAAASSEANAKHFASRLLPPLLQPGEANGRAAVEANSNPVPVPEEHFIQEGKRSLRVETRGAAGCKPAAGRGGA